MTRVLINSFSISADGYGAGPNQSRENPLGAGGEQLHNWAFPTRTFQKMVFHKDGGTTGVDETFAARGFRNIGAWILSYGCALPIMRFSWRIHSQTALELIRNR